MSSAPSLFAAEVSATVVDDSGGYVANAVIGLFADSAATSVRRLERVAPPGKVDLDQVGKQFVPHVLAIQAGTLVTFPNSDNIRHQVYSFSAAKRFELKLYSGRSTPPVLFDRAGVVVLGCNIHDWMSAYMYVLDTPYFALTDANGHAAIEVPEGRYTVRVWHPRYARGREPQVSTLQVARPVEEFKQTLALAAVDDASGSPPPS